MKLAVVAAAAAVSLAPATVLAQGGAISKDTSTSMGKPSDSPSFAAPRSAIIAGTPAQKRALDEGLSPKAVAKADTFDPAKLARSGAGKPSEPSQ